MFLAIDNVLEFVIRLNSNILLGVACFVFAFMVISTSFKLNAAESTLEHEQAKIKLTWLIIGLVLCALAIVIFNIFFGYVLEWL